MVRRVAYSGVVGSESHYFGGQPVGTLRDNGVRRLAGADLAALTTQVMTDVGLYLEKGDVVKFLTFLSGATAAGTPTNWWFALYNPAGDTGQVALTTQVMTSVPVHLRAGDVITSISARSGATAADTPTNWWFALYDPAGATLLGQTADQTNTAWAANTAMKVALASPYVVPTTGVYRAAIMVKATTVPTLAGLSVRAGASAAVVAGQAVLAQTSGTGLTTTAPATIATPTAVGTVPYVAATSA